jgi:hypothetical protein
MKNRKKTILYTVILFVMVFSVAALCMSTITLVHADDYDPGYPAPDPEFDIGYPIYWYGYPAPGYPAPEIFEEDLGYPAPEVIEVEKVIQPKESINDQKNIEASYIWKVKIKRVSMSIMKEVQKVSNAIKFWLK